MHRTNFPLNYNTKKQRPFFRFWALDRYVSLLPPPVSGQATQNRDTGEAEEGGVSPDPPSVLSWEERRNNLKQENSSTKFVWLCIVKRKNPLVFTMESKKCHAVSLHIRLTNPCQCVNSAPPYFMSTCCGGGCNSSSSSRSCLQVSIRPTILFFLAT